ncbi:uncharacterized protein PpBr36_09196 [Pyricularia pennisetigena]|uniref:uncharacterized protein n=1 Tax=Pyricularia pennisetigena TaxID=1578925 RepID=UPI0011549E4D|nr:uncharacterized protein PpBr36_09196 [Pyricularia pennisetigena]TLS21987.1 hypothetical protein PpBr36_09196 [Pyricularia pennisetigena]
MGTRLEDAADVRRRATSKSAKCTMPVGKRGAASQNNDDGPKAKRHKAHPVSTTSPRQVLDVYVFGSGASGELGLGVTPTDKKRDPTLARYPTRNHLLDSGKNKTGVVQVAVGGMHAAALTRDGRVLTWGVNDNKALGRDTEWQEPPEGLPDDVADLNPLESSPSAVVFPASAGRVCIVQVAACDSATFALTDDGQVYGWGSFRGSDGLFGFLYDSIKDKAKPRHDELLQSTPAIIPGLAGIKELSCGANHVLALTHSGNVMAWGSGEQGELGRRILGRRRFQALIPHPVGLPKNKTERIYAGFHHNFAVDARGSIYAWGLNNFGQAGIPTGEEQLTLLKPTVVERLKGFRIKHMAAGLHHSLACTEDGRVLAWGRCDDCQMGVALDDIPRDHLKFDSAQRPRILNTPTLVPGVDAVFVAAGIDNSMAISRDGRLFGWGFSSEYRTGLGTEDTVEQPAVAKRGDAIGKTVSFVGCGGQFSIAAGPKIQSPPLKGSENMPHHQASVMDEDEDNNEYHESVDRLTMAYGNTPRRPILVFDDDEVEIIPDDDDDDDDYVLEHIDLTGADYEGDDQDGHGQTFSRNRDLQPDQTRLDKYLRYGLSISPGTFVELNQNLQPFNIRFLEIKMIYSQPGDGRSKVFVRGIPYARNRLLRAMLETHGNEVCQIFEVDDNDPRQAHDQALVEVEFTAIKRVRQLVITNTPYPENSCALEDFNNDKAQAGRMGRLVCRWRHTIYYRDADRRSKEKAHRWRLEHLSEAHLPTTGNNGHSIRGSDLETLMHWRGGRIKGGSYLPGNRPPTIDLSDDDCSGNSSTHARGQRYIFGDMFCGAGGASQGARAAGFRLGYAVEHWNHAAATYRHNFPEVDLFEGDISDFFRLRKPQYVDVLHLSPPCQYWSPAKTRPGKNDEINMAALYACGNAVDKLRPRLFTLEQTFGILREMHSLHFSMFVRTFTSLGHSVEWGIVHLQDWGVPQPRKRLVMIGSCPGEALPTLPPASHGNAPGLRPYTTVNDVLASIPRGAQLHDVQRAERLGAAGTPCDGNTILGETLCCGRGKSCHPSGRRLFTERELAGLQGFPHFFEFRGSSVIKQIGNAFPPSAVEHLYKHLLDHLRTVHDVAASAGSLAGRRIQPRRRDAGLAARPRTGEDVVVIDGSDNESTSSSVVMCDRPKSPANDDDDDNDAPRPRALLLPNYPESMVVGGEWDDDPQDSDSDATMDGEEV